MTKVEEYRRTLRGLAEWERFLLEQSALPGPRANLELVGRHCPSPVSRTG